MASKITAPKILAKKHSGERIVCLTAYDFTSAAIADESGVDLILVGDSLGNVILGYDTTVPVTLDDMIHHTKAARRGVNNALLVADLPFGSYNSSTSQAVDSAVALMKAGAEAVKLEGDYPEAIEALVKAGIPTMGHVGFTPQSVNKFGGFKVQGKADSGQIVNDAAKRLSDAGAFSVVLELIPAELAKQITNNIHAATIGIGAGIHCDGEIQVFHDIMGFAPKVYKHTRHYAKGGELFRGAVSEYSQDVRDGKFPTEENSF
ncbi:MAG: 3-methyl-2-oxobutanoate hydroxymethyltransferase [Armatimonadetes bacterium]|nr:3-methyl-2-oxobutanoate hydroxymethyltransferase [Armatimonadota bacterium]